MTKNPFAPDFKDLPESFPIFPLDGVLLLPTGQLPLNIFEPRYLAMVEDAMKGNRMIGMIQPKPEKPEAIYKTGCVGKITDFSETADGRFEICLTGICRFDVAEELNADTPYRQVKADWGAYKNDLDNMGCLDLNREKLHGLLKTYFTNQELTCDWDTVADATDGRLITCLSMICPFKAEEKQALLEAACCKTRGKIFMSMLEMAVHDNKSACTSSGCH